MGERRGSRRKGSRGPSPSQRQGGESGQDGKAAESSRKDAGPGLVSAPGPSGGKSEAAGGGPAAVTTTTTSATRLTAGPTLAGPHQGGEGETSSSSLSLGSELSASASASASAPPPRLQAKEGLLAGAPPLPSAAAAATASESSADLSSPSSNVVPEGRTGDPLGPPGDGEESDWEEEANRIPLPRSSVHNLEQKLGDDAVGDRQAAGDSVVASVRDHWEDAIAETTKGLPTQGKEEDQSESARSSAPPIAVVEAITEVEEEDEGKESDLCHAPSSTVSVGASDSGVGGPNKEPVGLVAEQRSAEDLRGSEVQSGGAGVINSRESIDQPPALPDANATNGGRVTVKYRSVGAGERLGGGVEEEGEEEKVGGTMAEKTAEVGEGAAAPAATPPSSGATADAGSTTSAAGVEGGSTAPGEQLAATGTASTGAAAVPPAVTTPTPGPVKKHPLYNQWTLWCDTGSGGGGRGGPGGRQATWGSTLRLVYTFGFVEDFWCMYNNIKPPSDHKRGVDLHLFKRGVEPKWEDPVCERGGKWTVASPAKHALDAFWLNTLLALIGEQFDEGNDICGVVASIRDKDRISLWTSTATNEVRQMSIGRQWKSFLELGDKSMMGFTAHEDAKSGGGRGKAKELYYL